MMIILHVLSRTEAVFLWNTQPVLWRTAASNRPKPNPFHAAQKLPRALPQGAVEASGVD